jgi:hypothetical protein
MEDAIILPVVFLALAVKALLVGVFTILVRLLDYAFPIFLQLMRFPLFTLRIAGDGLAAIVEIVARCLPVSGNRQEALATLVRRHWSRFREKISYTAFEVAVHHAFESGMSWVFCACRTLTPRAALLVIFSALLWLPVSLVAATAMHAILIAKAAALPAWMQLLHPLATCIAKSKLLVLPVYPAAWPRAKQHPFVQSLFHVYRRWTSLGAVRKTSYRYRQVQLMAAETAARLRNAAAHSDVVRFFAAFLAGCSRGLSRIGSASRACLMAAAKTASRLPLVGALMRSYAVHYGCAGAGDDERLSDKLRGLYERWSVKCSAQYYEAKAEAAKPETLV